MNEDDTTDHGRTKDMDIHTLSAAAASLPQARPPAGAAAATPLADPQDTARFQALMAPPPAPMASALPDASAIAPVPEAGTSLGDAILKKVDEVHAGLESQWDQLSKAGQAQSPMTVTELMQFQSTAIQSSVQFELVGKVVSKSEQDLETLVKMQ
jgi:type III secretion system YscI/HrpB-like protein